MRTSVCLGRIGLTTAAIAATVSLSLPVQAQTLPSAPVPYQSIRGTSPNVPNTTTPAVPEGAVTVDVYSRNYEGEKSASEVQYDTRVQTGHTSRNARAGTLEGGWVVTDATGRGLVALQLRDGAAAEGAWRSLENTAAYNRSGLVERIVTGNGTLRIDYKGSGKTYQLDLQKETDRRWKGTLTDSAGLRTAVTMTAQ
ncbi:MAG: hypothetical protein QM645_05355 [Asticcacaulis sp.]